MNRENLDIDYNNNLVNYLEYEREYTELDAAFYEILKHAGDYIFDILNSVMYCN